MKKLASFIIDKKNIFLGVMCALALACVYSTFHTKVNGDMTKYLPDDSSMKIGLDLMNEVFPEAGVNATFKVMFDDLTSEQKKEVLAKLKSIEAVDSVSYVNNSYDYNRQNHTLYVLQTHHKYGTAEEKSIEKALKTEYKQYKMVWSNDNTGMIDIPKWIFVAAVAVLFIILVSTAGSWIEPFLFLAVIGVAIIMNMGTNFFLGSVSDITYSISAILQLVLSMDYSIILMNRYRQEKRNFDDRFTAMKAALCHAFTSVASSAMTTVIGLLMLCFMRFKIGMDLGIVLAKGVFLSMICVLIMLPGIILFFDKSIERTAKKPLRIPMGGLAKFSYKGRWIILAVFIILCGGSYFLQQQTNITYIFTKKDKILEVFPSSNTMVLLFENQDQEAANALADKLYEDEKVKTMMGFYATMTKEYTAEQLADNFSTLTDGMPFSAGLVNMLYYLYYNGKTVDSMTASQMLKFVSGTVLKDPTIATFLDEELIKSSDFIGMLSDAEGLNQEKSASELAEMTGMKADDIKSLFAYYFAERGGVETDAMTLKEFADFVVNEIASNPEYSSAFDKKTTAQLKQLQALTNVENLTKNSSASEIASIMDVDKETASMMMVCYKALSGTYTPDTMTFPVFADYLNKKILSNPAYNSYLDEETKAQASKITLFGSKEELQKQRTAEEMAETLGYAEKEAKQIYKLNSSAKTMSVEEIINFILTKGVITSRLSEEEKSGLLIAQKMINATVSGQTLTYTEAADLIGMDSVLTKILFTMKDSETKGSQWKAPLQKMINVLADNSASLSSMIGSEYTALLGTARKLVNAAVSGKAYSSAGVAGLMGMSSVQAKQLFIMKKIFDMPETADSWKIPVGSFIDFLGSTIVNDKSLSGKIDEKTGSMLKAARKLVKAVYSGKYYTAEEMSALMGGLSDKLNSKTMKIMYIYYASTLKADPEWKMSMSQLFDYVVNNLIDDPRFSSLLSDEARNSIKGAQGGIEEGKKMLMTDKYSRLVLNTIYPEESKETSAFLADIENYCTENFKGEFHMIGNSAMGFEMQKSFRKELAVISLLTIAAIFIIVALTFKSASIPLILVLLVQCGVYLTVSITGAIYGDMLYLALLIVECILMGATIDYGILLTNYYCDARKTEGVQESLKIAYEGSHHTILTSGLILILVTAIVGNFFGDPTVAAIIRTISMGALSAVVLILFVLPGVLAALDKVVMHRIGKGKKKE